MHYTLPLVIVLHKVRSPGCGMNTEHATSNTLPSSRFTWEPGPAGMASAAAAVPSTLVRAVKLRRGIRESRCDAGHPWLCIMRMDHLCEHTAGQGSGVSIHFLAHMAITAPSCPAHSR